MKKVTIYTTLTCSYCRIAKKFFTEHNIEYAEKDVGVDLEAADEMVRKSGQMGVPVIVIENGKEDIIVGFDEEALKQALEISK